MKIAVNARLLRKSRMDGIGWFTYNTLKYIVTRNSDIEFHFFFDSGIDKDFLFAPNIIPHNLFPPAKHAVLNVLWFELSVKKLLRRINPDVFLSQDGILCLGWDGPQYGVIHDINFVHIPQDLKWSNRYYYNYFFPKFARKASRLGTVSHFSKNDIVSQFSVDPEKIDVVYCGINSFYHPVDESTRKRVKQQFTGGEDYFVFVGTLHPRKNIIRLMQAFDTFKSKNSSKIKLVLVGWGMFKVEEIMAVKNSLSSANDIIFAGRLNDEDLRDVLGSALCLTFVPYFEGFGIPPVEAMQCDVPVICSNVTSMPEVVGEAALLVDPYNVNEIADAMENIAADDLLRGELVQKGRLRKDIFSWEKSADLLWQGISQLL